MVIIGPYCLVCGGRNVERRWVDGITAWTSEGPRYGRVQRDVCLDCEANDMLTAREQGGEDE